MCLQEAHRTDEETSHLFLLPSHQRTHQDMHTPSGCHAPLSSTFSENPTGWATSLISEVEGA